MQPIHEQATTNLLICFDESGKNSSDPIQLMGALSIPLNIYMHPNFNTFHALNQEFSFHWTKYGGDSKIAKGIEQLFEQALPLAEYMNFNMIRYASSVLNSQAQNVFKDIYKPKKTIVDKTIYTKLPERICYGLVRGYGVHNDVQAKILIEESSEYRSRNLDSMLKEALNIHSLYRGENFVITECGYRSKGEEIGIEFIDIFLGIVGIILTCPSYKEISGKKQAKVELVLKLLKQNKLQPFLKNLHLFELQQFNQLIEANVEASIKLFIAKNYEEFISL